MIRSTGCIRSFLNLELCAHHVIIARDDDRSGSKLNFMLNLKLDLSAVSSTSTFPINSHGGGSRYHHGLHK
jgi:hypothetical protein